MKVYLIILVIVCNNSIINKKGNKNHENINQKEVHVNYFGANDDAKRICNAFG